MDYGYMNMAHIFPITFKVYNANLSLPFFHKVLCGEVIIYLWRNRFVDEHTF